VHSDASGPGPGARELCERVPGGRGVSHPLLMASRDGLWGRSLEARGGRSPGRSAAT